MNVMTVMDVPVDMTIKIQSNDDCSAQDFASELNRANSNTAKDEQQALKTDKNVQADDRTETKKTEEKKEDQPDEQQKIHGINSVPVILCEQNTQVISDPAVQEAMQNEQLPITQNAGEGIITAMETLSQGAANNAEQAALPNDQAQYLPENAMQNPKAQAAVQKAAPEIVKTESEPLLQDAVKNVSGNVAAMQHAAPAALEHAEAFAGQAMKEIADLQKAAVNPAPQEAEKTANEALSNMQQTAQISQTVKTVQQNEQPVQPAVQNMQNVQQQDGQKQEQNALAGNMQTEDTAKEQTAGGETKQNAQDGAAKEPVAAQMQTTIGTSGAKVEFQQTVQMPEQPQVRQTVMTTIIDTISAAFGKETTEMTVQLKPEHLGGLSISLSMGESGLVAKMVTSEQSVQHMIHGEIGMLQEALRDKGIPVVHMEVSYGQTSNMANGSHAGNGGSWTTPSFTGNQAAYENMEEPVNYYYNLSNYDLLTEQGGSVEFSA